MQEHKPNPDIGHRFSEQWHWGEFLRTGSFWGPRYTNVNAANQPFDNWNELIGLIADTVPSNRALTSRM